MNIKAFVTNFIKNVFSYALPVAMLQFIVQPLIAAKLGSEANGLYLTIIAVIYFVTSITSAILLQVRLLKDAEYKEKGYVGDFNIILLAFLLLTVIAISVATVGYMNEPKLSDFTWSIVVAILYVVHDYMCVQYRLELNYTKILFSNGCLVLGYVFGILLFYFLIPEWQVVYVIAYATSFIYDYMNTDCLRERMTITPLFSPTIKKYLLLAGASFLSHLVSYGDRIILFPVTDGTSVSIFTSAEIMGKMMMLLQAPLASFLMAYIVKMDKIELKIPKKAMWAVPGFVVVLYVGCLVVSMPVLHILYPQWATESMAYVPYTTVISLANLLSAVLNVVVIRFCNSKWQIAINGSFLVAYLFFSFTLLQSYDLMGYCWGNMIAALFKLGFIVFIIKLNWKTIIGIESNK